MTLRERRIIGTANVGTDRRYQAALADKPGATGARLPAGQGPRDRLNQSTRPPYISPSGSAISSSRAPSGSRK